MIERLPLDAAPAYPATPVDGLAWQTHAACRGTDVEPFFPPMLDQDGVGERYCAVCPVRVPCLAYAVARGERFGIWGGLTPRERKQMSDAERARVLRLATRTLRLDTPERTPA